MTAATPSASWPIARHYRVTWEDACEGHAEALRTAGGRPGVLNEHLVRSAVGRPYDGYHRSIHAKAAALLHAVASNHGFADGNKRTAVYLVELLIRRSGYQLTASDRELVDIVVGVASGIVDKDDLIEWFRPRIKRPGTADRRPT